MIKKEPDIGVCVLGQHIHMSAHKARRVIDQIRGRSYQETLMILDLMPYRACYPIFKLVYSAAANASNNMGFNEANLIISKAEVNEGTIVKKLKPRARGRSYPIKRPTCHITIVLKEIAKDQKYSRPIFRLKHEKMYNPQKYIDISIRFLYMIGRDRLKWNNKENGGIWDKK
uniref:ribosomal protein L22 n=1 Tax=Hypecoum erectum TaxID=1655241 RepID=UPI0028FC7D76|nr:ribosomal protein L22 [Hypecoum erectum]BET06388.1 ribosomal protein L22 [Hypecoum erectum]